MVVQTQGGAEAPLATHAVDQILRVAGEIERQLKEVAVLHGLTMREAQLLLHLQNVGGLAIHEAARQLGRRHNEVSTTATKLEQCALLKRAKNLSSARMVQISLTPEGVVRAAEFRRAWYAQAGQCLPDITAAELDALGSMLSKMKYRGTIR